MKENEYRVWDNNSKCYCEEPGYITLDGGGHFEMFNDSEGVWESNGTNGSDLILEQYINIKDKNKVKIFEGDKVESIALSNDHNQRGATETRVIKSFMGSYCLCRGDDESGVPIYPFIVNHVLEIVGNVNEESNV